MHATQIWNNIIAWALQIGLLVGIGATLPALLRLRAPGARLRYWQLLLIACLALPWIRPWQAEVVTVITAPVDATVALARIQASAPVHLTIPPVPVIALWLLLAGAVVRLVWLAIGLLKLARYRRYGQPMPLPSEWTGLAGHARLLISDQVSGPVTFGFFRPVVLLPASFPSMPASMRDAILFHELLHVERRDWLFTFAEELVRAVFWLHPAIWWVLGEIQLAREQTVDRAVIDMTQARDPYMDTLLAMAGVTREPDLSPAPLFLRRRHLKQRLMGIVQEARMSKTRMIFAQTVALAMMAAACWVISGALPLKAQPQLVADSAGVTVNLNGSQLMHRSPILYPADAAAKGIEGTVVVQVRLDANGEVVDDAILSGPEELRKSVQQSVLNWHFDKSAGSATRVVNIEFVKPPSGAAPSGQVVAVRPQILTNPPTPTLGGRGGALPAAMTPQMAQQTDQAAVVGLIRDMLFSAEQDQARNPSPAGAAHLDDLKAKLQLALANQQRLQQTAPGKIENIRVFGLADSARDELLAQLPIHVGDSLTPELTLKTTEAARAFDNHLSTAFQYLPDGNADLRIMLQQPAANASVPPPAPQAVASGGPGPQRVGANVQATKLISQTKPVYPPLAKMARQQGTVKFEATIAKDGTMEDLKVISGPPLLIPAALEAVKTWAYEPTLLNGNPVEVITTIDVNFTLAE